MSNVVVMPPEQPTPEPKSFPARLVGVFFSPGDTFADIVRKPGFIAPLGLLVILSVAGTELFLAKIGMEPILRWAFEHNARTANMSPDDMQKMISRVVSIQTVIAHIAGVLWIPIVSLVVAGIGMAASNSLFGASIKFKTAFSVAAYAYLVNIVYSLMGAAMVFLGDPEHVISNPQNPTPTSLGFFLNPIDTSKPVMALGGSVEIFTFWYMALLGIGFSEASGKKAKATSVFLIFLGLWVIMALAKMGLSTLG
jgi:hypothetical protein